VPRQRGAVAAREQAKPIIEPCRNLWYPEHTTARCRQFDGERYAVEAPANSRYFSCNATVWREVRIGRACSRNKQPNRAVSQQLFRVLRALRRHGE
jgi:hypothetical protein